MTKARSNATANAAKGDLTVGNGTNLSGVLGVGSNGDTIVADSSTSTGLRYQGSQSAGKNAIINGGYDIWQRGTSFGSGAQYTADRWYKDGQTYSTISRQASGLTGFQYSCRTQRNAGQTGTADLGVVYNLETADSLRFAGQTITVSFWAKCGANFSPTSSRITVYVASGTGTDQLRSFSATYTGEAAVINTTQAITTTWARYSFTGAVGSTATQLCAYFAMAGTGTAGANDWFELAGVQMELGSVATSFLRQGGSIQGELAACQRYYFRIGGADLYETIGLGFAWSSTRAGIQIKFPVTMRRAPSSVDFSLPLDVSDSVTATAVTTGSMTSVGKDVAVFRADVASGLTTYRPMNLTTNNSLTAYVGFSAEL
jgi:hypothetical protein